MPACESKLVSTSSRKATVAKTVLNGYNRKPSLVGDRGPVLQVLGWALRAIYHWYYGAVEKKAEVFVFGTEM